MALGAPIDPNGHILSLADLPVVISGEQAVIIWDEEHRIEHFIRQADIHTSTPNVGFFVPTPQTPELVEVDAAIFREVAEMARPLYVPTKQELPLKYVLGPILGGPLSISALLQTKRLFSTINTTLAYAGGGGQSAPPVYVPPPVQVILEQNVASYHATVLEARDVDALLQWFKDNHYVLGPEARAWLKPYIDHGWKITAFKLNDTSAHGSSFQTRAIRMSFSTERPFFPYSEPRSDASPSGRSLTVAFLGPQRVSGALEDGTPWSGELQFSGPPKMLAGKPALNTLAKLTSPTPAGLAARLTYFRDTSNPRLGTSDLYFSPSADQTLVRKTEIDPQLPPLAVTAWYFSPGSILALLAMFLVPGILIYSGWQQRRACLQSDILSPQRHILCACLISLLCLLYMLPTLPLFFLISPQATYYGHSPEYFLIVLSFLWCLTCWSLPITALTLFGLWRPPLRFNLTSSFVTVVCGGLLFLLCAIALVNPPQNWF